MALSKREIQVLELARSGSSIKMTANELGISHYTVKATRQSINKKLGCNNITGALDVYQKQKLLSHA